MSTTDIQTPVYTLEQQLPKDHQVVWIARMPTLSHKLGDRPSATLNFVKALFVPDNGFRLLEDPPEDWGMLQVNDGYMFKHAVEGPIEVNVARPWNQHYRRAKDGIVWAEFTGLSWDG